MKGHAEIESAKLLPIQQLIADEVADMLIHGGHESDIESLIFAAVGHQSLRMFLAIEGKPGQWNDPECREHAEKLVIRDASGWKAQLQAAWVENLRASVQPTSIDAVERIRACVMAELRELFEEFLTHGSPEDHRLMRDVLRSVNGSTTRNVGSHAVALGYAFNCQLGSERAYLQVPERIREDVEEHITALLAQPAIADVG